MADEVSNDGMARATLAKVTGQPMASDRATAYATIAQAYATLALVDVIRGNQEDRPEIDHCQMCGGIVEGEDPYREFCDACSGVNPPVKRGESNG